MKRLDLRSGIIPKRLKNSDSNGIVKEEYDTLDLIYIDSYEEQFGKNIDPKHKIYRRTYTTDHAKMHNASIYDFSGNPDDNIYSYWWLRSSIEGFDEIYCVENDGSRSSSALTALQVGIRPSLLYNLPNQTSNQLESNDNNSELNIIERKDKNGNILYHCLQLGERPKSKLDKNLSEEMEQLYNRGKLQKGINATGRWYTNNAQPFVYDSFIGIHSPEFEYKGNKYAREILSNVNTDSYNIQFSDGTKLGKAGKIIWTKVEPVNWIIRNWDDMPKSINPDGTGKAKYFDLIAEEILIGNVPFYPNTKDENCTMWQNSIPRGYLNGIDVRNIVENGSPEHSESGGGDFSGECNFLNETFNLARKPIYEYTIPESETKIAENAFNGCVTLKKVKIHSGVKIIGKGAFDGIDFKYLYKLKSTGEFVFDTSLPHNKEDIEEIVEIGKLTKSFIMFPYQNILRSSGIQKEKIDRFIKFADALSKNNFSIPAVYASALITNGLDEDFYNNSDFRFFNSEFKNINDVLLDYPEEERLDFFKVANALGCFSKEKVLDKNGRTTETLLGQKATSILSKLLKCEDMKLGKYHTLFDSLDFDSKVEQEFLDFIIKEDVIKVKDQSGRTVKKERKLSNLELLIKLEKQYPGIFIKVMTDFSKAKSFRECLDEKGKPIKVSWEEALKRYYLSNKYVGVAKENRDIAEVFGGKGLSQEVFDKAIELRTQAKENEVEENILGENLREETILESIERIRKQTETELQSGKEVIEELYDKQFTYEWLSKNDPANSIMGLFCSCCGTITSSYYGKNIAKASVIAKDVQNLVIRNNKGDIISKGTFYLNRERGYGVINDFELNQAYRNHEDGISGGRYNVPADSKEEQERELIFKAFKRGVQAFVEKYDEKNPEKPINQINVGTGYNKLKAQIERFRRSSKNLTVPAEYSFKDAEKGQYVLYERKNKTKEIHNMVTER